MGAGSRKFPPQNTRKHISPVRLLLPSAASQLLKRQKNRKPLNDMHTLWWNKKKRKNQLYLESLGFTLKEATDSFVLLWSDSFEANLLPSVTAARFCELWQSELALGSVSLCAFARRACFTRACSLWFWSVFERGRPLPLLGFYILTTWKPGGLKIAQRFPIFVSFRDHFLRVFWVFACVPPECSGSAAATSCHMVPRRGCPQFFLNSLRRSQK